MRYKLIKLFNESIASVNPSLLIRRVVKLDDVRNEVNICGQIFNANLKYHVLGFGKAVHRMAGELQSILKQRINSGVIIVPTKTQNIHLSNIKVFEGATNNLPDNNAVEATEEVLRLTRTISPEDITIVLISGGGSSLLCKPVNSITLEDKLLTIQLLVTSGADIRELNTVRKVLSSVKGGGLAKILENRKTVCLILSDVIGNAVDVIASGPTVPNNDSKEAALDIVRKYKLELKIPKHVMAVIGNPKIISCIDGHNITNTIIGSNEFALANIMKSSEGVGCKKLLLSSSIEGLVPIISDAYLKVSLEIIRVLLLKDFGVFFRNMRNWAREYESFQVKQTFITNLSAACEDHLTDMIILLMGGETTVQISGNGVGGRNQQLAVTFSKALHCAVEREPELFSEWGVMILGGGTDGIDGPTAAAGALGCAEVIENGIKQGLDVDKFLNNNDTFSYLSKINNGEYLLRTGHTGTNVMDIHLLAIYKKHTVSV